MKTIFKKYWYFLLLFVVYYFMTNKKDSNFVSNLPKNMDIPSTQDEQLTKNLRLKEFHSKDGAPMPYEVYLNIRKLAIELQKIRDWYGKPMTINSGYRSPEHNKAVNGASQSYHMKGMAADFNIKGVSPENVRALIRQDWNTTKTTHIGGLGSYKNFTHYDIRNGKQEWKS